MRLTGRGFGLLGAALALLAVGFGFGYPELAALGCASVVAVAGALAFVAWQPRLSVRRSLDPDRVSRGEPSLVRLRVTNVSRLFGASLVARDRLRPGGSRPGGSRPGGRSGGSVPVPLVRLRPGRLTEVSYPLPTARRGVIDVGPLEISRRDPLAVARVSRQYGQAGRIWVHPRVHPIAAVPVGLSRSMDGRVDRVPHGSITFSALRPYVVGDDLRHVHWRTSARVGELMVREHVDTSLPRIVILLDDRAGAHQLGADNEPTFEAACEAAASVLVAAVREGIQVELRLVSGAAAAGHLDVGPMLDLLAEASLVTTDALPGPAATALDASGVEPLRAALESLRVRRIGDTLLFLTGPPNEDDLGRLAGLRGAYPSIIAGVFGPVEGGLTTTAGLLVVGAADGADFAAAWDGIRAW